jgi:hypothetical protein
MKNDNNITEGRTMVGTMKNKDGCIIETDSKKIAEEILLTALNRLQGNDPETWDATIETNDCDAMTIAANALKGSMGLTYDTKI